jgi:capsular polysaccharide biosynthesis protein
MQKLQQRGPKPKPASEKKVSVNIWVKAKYAKEAQQMINNIAKVFNDRG